MVYFDPPPFFLVPTRLVKGSLRGPAPHPQSPRLTAGPGLQTVSRAPTTTGFLSPRLEPRCNCDPARDASLRGAAGPEEEGGLLARPALGSRPPKWRARAPRAERSSRSPAPPAHAPSPAGISAAFLRDLQPAPRARPPSLLSTLFTSLLAFLLSGTPFTVLSVGFAGAGCWGSVGIWGDPRGSWGRGWPRAHGGAATGRASA